MNNGRMLGEVWLKVKEVPTPSPDLSPLRGEGLKKKPAGGEGGEMVRRR